MSIPEQKILFFSEFFYPSQTSTAYYVTEIANSIAKTSGKQVHVYCATPFDDSQTTYSKPDNLIIHRIDNGKGNKNKLIPRILKFARISIKFSLSILVNASRNDILFSVTNPAFIIPVCAVLKGVLHYKYVMLAYDIFPENLIAADLLQKNSLLYKVAKRIFDWGYRKADIVISIGQDMTEILKQKGVLDDRIVLIQNWADVEVIKHHPKDDNPIINQYNLENNIVFMYAGNFGRVQGIPELLEIIDHVSANNAAFLFIGDGAMRGTIEKYQKEHPFKKVYCHPYLPMNQQYIFLNACDVAIVTLNEKMYGLGVPSKSYYSLASGHPILFMGNNQSEVAHMIQEGQCGWQISFDSIKENASFFDSICSLPQKEIEDKGVKASEYLRCNFSKKIILKKYSQLFQRLYQK